MIKNYVILTIFFIFSSLSFANDDDDEKIYFCTKDLDSLQSSPDSVTSSNSGNAGNVNMQVYFPLENDKHNILNLRHCFMLFGTLHKKDSDKLYLSGVTTFGYGGNPNQEEGIKTGGAYQEPNLENKVVSCVPVMENLKLITQEDIYEKWGKVIKTMNKEVKKTRYNTLGHNCCSVSYKAVEAIGGNLSKINPSNFNLYGLGIIWGQTAGTLTDNLIFSTSYPYDLLIKSVDFSSSPNSPSSEEKHEDL